MEIYLCKNTNLVNDYLNTVCFNTISEQRSWFYSKVFETATSNIKPDSMQTNITISKNINNIELCDYLYFISSNKYYFYFVNSVEYRTEGSCILNVECDVIQTYLFDIDFKESFVKRSHVKRWDNDYPIFYGNEESLDYGEYKLLEQQKLYTFKNQYLITSSSPLGKIKYQKKSNGGGGGDIGSDGDWKNGVVSANGFRFIKGYEGYAPYHYDDGLGYMTIGYGITAHGEPDEYNRLLANEPVPEDMAAQSMYNNLTKNYGLPIVSAVLKLGCNKQQQFDALVDLAYNSGTGSITSSNSLMDIIAKNPNDRNAIEPVWRVFKINAGTSTEAGLRLRRQAEINIYFDGNYEMREIAKLDSSGRIVGTVTENNGNGWLPSKIGGGDTASKIINGAMTHIGEEYSQANRYGYPPFDCSSFVDYCYRTYGGIDLKAMCGGDTTHYQRYLGTSVGTGKVAESKLKLGDIVFSSSYGHVMLYAGNDTLVHASNSRPYPEGGVKTSSYSGYSGIVEVRRVL